MSEQHNSISKRKIRRMPDLELKRLDTLRCTCHACLINRDRAIHELYRREKAA